MAVLYARVGGAWVPVGGAAADEVFVGPTAPTDSAVELWYDSSAVTVGAGLAGSGTAALRPATPSTPGFQYFATDTKILSLWDGAAWQAIGGPVPWINVTFANGWMDYLSGYQNAQYRKIGDIVTVRGLVKSGTVGAAIFTLPAGYRPPAAVQLTVDNGAKYGALEIRSDGVITTIPVAGVSNAVLNLNGVQFSVT